MWFGVIVVNGRDVLHLPFARAMRDVGDVVQPDALVRAPRAVWVVADLAAASDHLDAHEAEEDAENSAERGVADDFNLEFVTLTASDRRPCGFSCGTTDRKISYFCKSLFCVVVHEVVTS